MAQAIRMHSTGGPDVLRLEEVAVGAPGPGQARLRHVAVGLNFADTYFRTGLYPVPLPNGIGVEAAGIVEAVGEGVTNVAPGDRVTYTGFLNTLGAYSTERVIPAAPLIKLPAAISCETAAAMTMRGLTSAYLMRRIWPLAAGDTILLHAAAGGVGLIVSQWAKLLGLTVIGTVSTEAKAEVARAHGCDHVIDYTREDVAKRVRELTDGAGVDVVYDSVGKNTFAGSLDSLKRRGLLVCVGTASGPIPPIDATQLAIKGSVFVTRPALADYIADPAEKSALAGELFDHVAAGRIRIEINQRYRLPDAAAGAPRSRSAQDHRLVDLRDLTRRLDGMSRRHNRGPHSRQERPAHDDCNKPRRSSATRGSIKVEPLTCTIGAELSNVDLGVASRDAGLVAEIRALLLKHKVLFFRDQDITRAEHVAFARHFGELEDHPVAGSDPEHPGPRAHLQVARCAGRPLRERVAHRRDVAREAAVRLRAALRRMPAGRRRHDVGRTWSRPTPGCPRTSRRRIAGPARAPQHRGELRRRDADREAACAEGAVSRRRASGRAHAPGDRREDPLRQRLHDALHQLSHGRERALRPGRESRARACC